MAAAACAIVTAASVVVTIAARRLMHGERARRRWQEVGLLRQEQDTLKAQRALDIVALALAGDRQAAGLLSRIGRPDVVQAIRRHDHELRRLPPRPEPSKAARQHAPAEPRPLDIKAAKAKLKRRRAELDAAEARIQALAQADDKGALMRANESWREAQEARDAALAADRVARERVARGQKATQPEGGIRLQLGADAIGGTNVKRLEPEQTPEQIAPPRRAEPPQPAA